MHIKTIKKLISSGWSKDDFYKNDYNVYNFDNKFNTNLNNFDHEHAPSESDHLDFNSPDGFGNIFFFFLGGLLLFMILVILFKCCCKKTDSTTATTTAATVSGHNHQNRSALFDNHFINVDYGPTDDITMYNEEEGLESAQLDITYNDEDRVELAQLDLPPSYDLSTQNSRCNSTHDLHDSSNHCNVPDTTQNDVAPPSYSEVCQSDYNVE